MYKQNVRYVHLKHYELTTSIRAVCDMMLPTISVQVIGEQWRSSVHKIEKLFISEACAPSPANAHIILLILGLFCKVYTVCCTFVSLKNIVKNEQIWKHLHFVRTVT